MYNCSTIFMIKHPNSQTCRIEGFWKENGYLASLYSFDWQWSVLGKKTWEYDYGPLALTYTLSSSSKWNSNTVSDWRVSNETNYYKCTTSPREKVSNIKLTNMPSTVSSKEMFYTVQPVTGNQAPIEWNLLLRTPPLGRHPTHVLWGHHSNSCNSFHISIANSTSTKLPPLLRGAVTK